MSLWRKIQAQPHSALQSRSLCSSFQFYEFRGAKVSASENACFQSFLYGTTRLFMHKDNAPPFFSVSPFEVLRFVFSKLRGKHRNSGVMRVTCGTRGVAIMVANGKGSAVRLAAWLVVTSGNVLGCPVSFTVWFAAVAPSPSSPGAPELLARAASRLEAAHGRPRHAAASSGGPRSAKRKGTNQLGLYSRGEQNGLESKAPTSLYTTQTNWAHVLKKTIRIHCKNVVSGLKNERPGSFLRFLKQPLGSGSKWESMLKRARLTANALTSLFKL